MNGMETKPHGLKVKFSLLYALTCGAMACYYPFMAIFYQSKELDYSEIGRLFAINSLIAVFAQPVWGIITDKYLDKRRTLLIALAASAVVALGFLQTHSYVGIIACVSVFMIFQSPILSINDAYCYEAIDVDKSLQYGKLRLMGSVGYAMIALFLAYLIEWTSIDVSFYGYGLFCLLSIVVLRTIRVKGKSAGRSIDLKDVAGILNNRSFRILCLSALITSACMNANGSYLAILIQKTGGNVSNIGVLWFVVAIAELPAFYFGARFIKKIGPLNMYLTGLAFYSSRFLLDSLCGTYQLVIALQLMQAITYPLYTMATLQYVNDIVPIRTRTTAITVFAALTSGFGGFLGNIAGASIIKNSNVFVMFRILSMAIVAAFLIGMVLKLMNKPAAEAQTK